MHVRIHVCVPALSASCLHVHEGCMNAYVHRPRTSNVNIHSTLYACMTIHLQGEVLRPAMQRVERTSTKSMRENKACLPLLLTLVLRFVPRILPALYLSRFPSRISNLEGKRGQYQDYGFVQQRNVNFKHR